MFAIIIAILIGTVTPNPATQDTFYGDDFTYTHTVECVAVIKASGYTTALDIHRKVTPTPEFLEACF